MSAEGIKQMQCQVHKSLSAGKNKLLQLFSHIIHAEIPKNDRFFFFHVQLKHFEKMSQKKKRWSDYSLWLSIEKNCCFIPLISSFENVHFW